MLKVGVTGGIGSGKSTVIRILEQLGVAVYDSDSRAKAIMNDDPKVMRQIVTIFGPSAYGSDGTLQRRFISERAFSDSTMLGRLNAVVHPAIERDFAVWCDRIQSTCTAQYVVQEAAILIESGAYKRLDVIVVVVAPEELRMRRVMERDSASQQQVRDRMAAQLSDAERTRYADFVIVADDKSLLIPQVVMLDTHLRELSQTRKAVIY